MTKNNKLLDHVDAWLRLLFFYLNGHKWQGRILFFCIGVSIIVWATIVALYTGMAIYELISHFSTCKI